METTIIFSCLGVCDIYIGSCGLSEMYFSFLKISIYSFFFLFAFFWVALKAGVWNLPPPNWNFQVFFRKMIKIKHLQNWYQNLNSKLPIIYM